MSVLAGQLGPLAATSRRAAASWAPDVLGSLSGWWDTSDPETLSLDGGAIVSVADKTGNADIVAPTVALRPPSLSVNFNGSGKNVAYFDRSRLVVDDPAPLGNLFHVFGVVAMADSSVHGVPDYPGWCGQGNGAAYGTLATPHQSAGGAGAVCFYGTSTTARFSGGGYGMPIKGGAPRVLSIARRSNSAGNLELTVDGGSPIYNGGTAPAPQPVSFALGLFTTAYFWVGEIAEVLLFDGALGSVDRQMVEGYLAHKYALAGSLPGDHPYKSEAP